LISAGPVIPIRTGHQLPLAGQNYRASTSEAHMTIIDLPGYEGKYAASDDGNIYSLRTRANQTGIPRRLKGILNPKTGYLCVNLYRDGQHEFVAVHVLIATVFLPPKPAGPNITVNHKDLDKQNNRPDNLEWLTMGKNYEHFLAARPGHLAGERNPRHKLTEQEVMRVHLFKDMASLKELADHLCIGPAYVWQIQNGQAWKHIYRRIYGT
jgi:hypothetical protein